jgi:tryptophan 2,3-dioxygenase
LESASGFQSAQFRELEVVLGRRDRGVVEHYPDGSQARAALEAAIARPTLWDSYLAYLSRTGYEVGPDEEAVLLAVYADDGGAAQVAEHLVDLDEGLQEWRYRHVKMVERTIGDQPGTGGSMGAAYLRSTVARPAFPALWAVRSRL